MILLFAILLNAMEIDEKLTVRILKVSRSRKTILINRGSQDGLAEGDHAKLYVTKGIIGRAILIKLSSSRSVWSIYRIIDPYEIEENTVANLKKAVVVPLTEDATQGYNYPLDGRGNFTNTRERELMIRETDPLIKDIESEGENLTDLELSEEDENLSDLDLEELIDYRELTNNENTKNERSRERKGRNNTRFGFNTDGSTEITGIPIFDYFTNNFSWSSNQAENSVSKIGLKIGLEKYLYAFTPTLKDFSIIANLVLQRTEYVMIGASTSMEQLIGLDAGIRWYFKQNADKFDTFIPYAGLSIGFGLINGKYVAASVNGSGTNFMFGANTGIKYNFRNGIGIAIGPNFSYSSSTYPSTQLNSELGATSTKIDIDFIFTYKWR